MREEDIVRNWREGHSRKWLIDKELKDLKPFATTKEQRANLSWQAQHNVEEALIKWYRREVMGE